MDSIVSEIVFKQADEFEILKARELFELTFSIKFPEELWKRKYFANPAGKPIAFIAKSDDQVVSFYALHPSNFMFLGKPVLLYQDADSMTHPDFRRRGIHKVIKKNADDYLATQNIPVSYGFPNLNTMNTKQMAPFELVGRFTNWVKPLSAHDGTGPGSLFNRIGANVSSWFNPKANQDLVVKTLLHDERLDRVWDSCKNDYPIIGERSSRFLEWRFGGNPNIHIWLATPENPEGYIVVEQTVNGLWIRDFLISKSSKHILLLLLAAIIDYGRKEKLRHLTFPLLEGEFRRQLLSSGFFPLTGKAPFIIYQLADHSPEWIQKRNWHITDADRDIQP